MRAFATAFGALAVIVLVSGCSAQPADGPMTFDRVLAQAEEFGSPAQVEMLADGKLTRSELDRSLASMFDCFAAEGIWSEREGVNPLDGWRPLYGVSMEDPGRVEACNLENYKFIALGWELVNEDVTDAALMAVIQDCLESRGESVTGAEKNLNDLAPSGGEDSRRLDLVRVCASSAPELFPSLIFVYK